VRIGKRPGGLPLGRLALCLLALLAALVDPTPARADLQSDVTRLAASWRARDAEVREYPPHQLERGEAKLLLLPEEATSSKLPGCTTVAVLGAVSTSFVLRFAPPRHRSQRSGGEWPRVAVAGIAEVTRCGDTRGSLSRLVVEMRSPRAVLEVVVARSLAPLSAVDAVLPQRNPGPVAQPIASGPRPMLGPLSVRAKAIEAAARRRGAAFQERRLMTADGDGAGEKDLVLDEGCHRIDVLGPTVATTARPPDIDAMIVDRATLTPLASDRTESADATLELCVGQRAAVQLHFAGAPARNTVTVLHARTPLPTGLPEHWGPQARGHMAEALRAHHLRSLGGSPVYASLGVVGVTALPVRVEPGACYVAAVAALRGDEQGLALAASAGTKDHQNQTGASGTALAFCARASTTALIEIEARGRGLVWLFALWQTGRVPIVGASP